MNYISGLNAVAIIPARAGSKGLPGKNTMSLAGMPLIAHTIKAALESQVFKKVVVTTDDDLAIAVAVKMGAVAVRRPKELASDQASMASVVLHALAQNIAEGVEVFALLQPTSPLRTSKHIIECADLYCNKGCNSVVSICALDHPPQKALYIENERLLPFLNWGALNQNRQLLKAAYRQNGAIWFVDCQAFLKDQNFVVEPAFPYEMSLQDSVDIDTAEDFSLAEKLLNLREAGGH